MYKSKILPPLIITSSCIFEEFSRSQVIITSLLTGRSNHFLLSLLPTLHVTPLANPVDSCIETCLERDHFPLHPPSHSVTEEVSSSFYPAPPQSILNTRARIILLKFDSDHVSPPRGTVRSPPPHSESKPLTTACKAL